MRGFLAWLAAAGLVGLQAAHGQTVTYPTQTASFNALLSENNNAPPFAGTYDNTATELANYANGGSVGTTPAAAALQTFTTTGNGLSGTPRPLQVGDAFTITGYTGASPSTGGSLGISFRDSTSYAAVSSAIDAATEARFQLDTTGSWKVYSGAAAIDSGLGAGSDRTFTITITSGSTFNAAVGANTSYNLGMAAGGGAIDSLAIYTFGDSNANSFWKNAALTATGTVQLGNAAPSGVTFTPGLISDGLVATSTSLTQANAVFIGGDAGSQVNLTQANTYTGPSTINPNAASEAQHAAALGSTAAGTVVSANGVLKLFGGSGISYAPEPLTLNGVGVAGVNGALRSVGGTNSWTGPITLESSSRITADVSGGAGSLAITGNVAGGSNVLFFGAAGAAISVSGTIGGAGASQDGTVTSVFKDGASPLTLSAANTYTGDTRITSGTLVAAAAGSLGIGSDVFVSSGATLEVLASLTVGSLRETAVGNGGTTVSAGTLATGVPLATSAVSIAGGEFAAAAADILGDTIVVSLSGPGLYTVGGSDTIGSPLSRLAALPASAASACSTSSASIRPRRRAVTC